MNEISTPTCEGERLPAICEMARKNGELAADINVSMSSLLELLAGAGQNESCNVATMPSCLLDDIVRQGSILSDIHTKLRHVIEVLQG